MSPALHYMVDITKRMEWIKEYVDKGKYFVINRARQYGKTTTLQALREYLKEDYTVVSMDFQRLDSAKYKDGNTFALAFAAYFLRALKAGFGECADKMMKAYGRQFDCCCQRKITCLDLLRM